MPSINRQVNILFKAGVKVPPFSARRLPVQERYLREGLRIPQEELDADTEQRQAVDRWRAAVESMYEALLAVRVTRALQPNCYT